MVAQRLEVEEVGKFPVLSPFGSLVGFEVRYSDNTKKVEAIAGGQAGQKKKDPSKAARYEQEKQETRDLTAQVSREQFQAPEQSDLTKEAKPSNGNAFTEPHTAISEFSKDPVASTGAVAGGIAAQAVIPGGQLPIIGDFVGKVGSQVGSAVASQASKAFEGTRVPNPDLDSRLSRQRQEEERARLEALEDFSIDL